jgi:hypothetical protein
MEKIQCTMIPPKVKNPTKTKAKNSEGEENSKNSK